MANKIILTSFDQALTFFEGEEKDSIKFCEEKGFFEKSKIFSGSFETKEELKNSIKLSIVSLLEEEGKDVKDRIYSLLKKGIPVKFLSLEFMPFKLKLKIFKSSFHLKDLQKLLLISERIKKELKKYEKSVIEE